MALYVSLYTKNTAYERIAGQLEESLKKFDLRYRIDAVEDQGSWTKNTYLKPEIILDALEGEEDIVWIDADNIVLRRPEIFDDGMDCDLAFHSRIVDDGGWSPLSSVMYWKQTQASLELVRLWLQKSQQGELGKAGMKIPIEPGFVTRMYTDKQNDQHTFANALWELVNEGRDIRIADLSKEYAMKYDSVNRSFHDPYIIMNQAGRIFNKEEGSKLRKKRLNTDRDRWEGAV